MISYKKLFLMMEEREITKEKLKNEIGNCQPGAILSFEKDIDEESSNITFDEIIDDKSQEYYKPVLREYTTEKGYLIETCSESQDIYKKLLKYFEYI